MMYHQSDMLAITEGCPPPKELPPEFHSRVRVHEIIDSEYPGYVYLLRSYLLTEDSDAGKYNAIQDDKRNMAWCCFENVNTTDEIHGPALTLYRGETELPCDEVPCVRCLPWPSLAADWPTRHRNYDWPDSATVDLVVSNGCDVVRVAHRLCRQVEWMNMYQSRLSFSRAEIVLLNSWMPVQQIIYHKLCYESSSRPSD